MRIPLKAGAPQPRHSPGSPRWHYWWLELSSAVVIAVVIIICLAHVWTAPLLLDPLLAVLPALAGIGASGPRRPLAVGAATLAAAIIIEITATGATRGLPQATIAAVVVATVVASVATVVKRTSQVATTQQHLANVVSVAEAAQRAVLRPLPEHLGPLDLGVVYLAAAADAQVGGDLYDVARTPHGIRLIVGDVRGKGLGAVEVAADVLGMYREIAHEVHTLPELARRLDAGLARRWGEHEEFVTAVLAEINPKAGRLSLFNCGHPPPMLIGAPGPDGGQPAVTVLEVPAPAPPLGLLTLGDPSGASLSVPLKPRDQLLLYTDGVTEARDSARRFYPLQERLDVLAARAQAAGEHRSGNGNGNGSLLDLLRADLIKHVGAPLDDDAALLLVRAPASWQSPARGSGTGSARAITA